MLNYESISGMYPEINTKATVAKPLVPQRENQAAKSKRLNKLIVELLEGKKEITVTEIMDSIGCSRNFSYSVVDKLVDEGKATVEKIHCGGKARKIKHYTLIKG